METLSTYPLALPGFLLALFLILTVHELGHFAAARTVGVPVKLVALGVGPALWRKTVGSSSRLEWRLLPLGVSIGVLGRRNPDGTPRRPLFHDMAVAAGGPGASLLLAILFIVTPALAAGSPLLSPHVQEWFLMTGALSFVLTGLNLIPLPGLDGGHLLLLAAAWAGLRLSPRGEATVHKVGIRLASALCVLLIVAQAASSFA